MRLPRKNIRLLGGKPLIAWTLEPALASGLFVDVLVSTDDPEIARVARECGACVPWLRPAELASDTATTMAVLQHGLDWFESERGPVSAVMLLQPTSPFRSESDLRRAMQQYQQHLDSEPRTLVSVCPAATHPAWCFQLNGGQMAPVMGWDILKLRSQELPPVYALNGSICVIPSALLRAGEPFLGPRSDPFVMSGPGADIDIDTDEDWALAEVLVQT